MNDSNRDGVAANVQADGARTRTWVMGLILCLLAASYGTWQYANWHQESTAKKAASDYAAFLDAVAKADAMADPLQRCLNYPDMPGSHWDADTTRAYCVLRNHKTISLSEIDALLKQGRASEIDRTFQGYLDTQRSDAQQPGIFDIAFATAGFDEVGVEPRRIIDAWKRQSPNSAFALAASGDQYIAEAHNARGSDWGYKLTDEQVTAMHQQLALATEELDRAVVLNPFITYAYADMIDAGGVGGDDDYMNRSAASAIKIESFNYAIRMQMMNYAQPKWGSSFDGEGEQSKEDLSLVNKNPLLRLVVNDPIASDAACNCHDLPGSQTLRLVTHAFDKSVNADDLESLGDAVYEIDRRVASELYTEALRFDPMNLDVMRWRSQEMIALGDKRGAVDAYAALAARFPHDNDMAAGLGNIYAQVGDVKNAEATLQSVLQRDPDNYEALGRLGDLYNHGAHQPDKAEQLADILIAKYPDKPYGWIVRSCNQMDHNLPGVYDTIHFFIDHFGDDPQWKDQTAEMRAYLVKHPEKVTS